MKKSLVLLGLASSMAASVAVAASPEEQKIEDLQSQIKELESRLNLVADQVEQNQQGNSTMSRVSIGGYGEMHYNNLDVDGEDFRELDFHRLVIFVGYQFNDRARFVTEIEVEHIIASAGNRGAVEVEQAYVEFDLNSNMNLQTGAILMPIGIINETHEPPTFYGVERPVIETTIIPTTWWSGGVKFAHRFDNGFSYDLMLSEGLKTEDPNSDPAAEPFNLKLGKQKASFASAYDLAMTGRVKYARPGLELAAYAQYQPDLDQSAKQSYADDATLLGGHVIYQLGDFTGTLLYARWDLSGDEAAAAGMDVQDGGYAQLSWKPLEKWGFFVRQNAWSQEEGVDQSQTDAGVNFYPYPNIVFKFDVQMQNDDAGNADGFNLGFGYQF